MGNISQCLYAILLFACAFLVSGCNSTYSPKPPGYFKIDLPERAYQVFDKTGYQKASGRDRKRPIFLYGSGGLCPP